MADRAAVLAELARRGKLPEQFRAEYNTLAASGALGKAGASQANTNFDNLGKLRSEFNSQTPVKVYRAALPVYAAALQSGDTPAGDLNLVYAYAKIMDPDSVVRESEQQSVSDLGTLGQKIYGQFAKQIDEKGKLTPKLRFQMNRELANRLTQYNKQYTQHRGRYKALGKKFGFDPQDIVGQHEGDTYAPIENQYFRGDPNLGPQAAKQQQSRIKFMGFE